MRWTVEEALYVDAEQEEHCYQAAWTVMGGSEEGRQWVYSPNTAAA